MLNGDADDSEDEYFESERNDRKRHRTEDQGPQNDLIENI